MSELDALIADARRAAQPGAVGDAADRNGALIGAQMPGGAQLRTAPSASALDAAIDGPGLFVFSLHGARRYARLGDFSVDPSGYLVNARGARALGFGVNAGGDAIAGLTEVRVPPADVAAHRFNAYRIDERGVLEGLAGRVDIRSGRSAIKAVALGRIALAVVPAPERLRRDGDTMLLPTRAAGDPSIVVPAQGGAARLLPHAREAGMVDLEGDLARLWSVRRRLEFANAVAAASDKNARVALGLVK